MAVWLTRTPQCGFCASIDGPGTICVYQTILSGNALTQATKRSIEIIFARKQRHSFTSISYSYLCRTACTSPEQRLGAQLVYLYRNTDILIYINIYVVAHVHDRKSFLLQVCVSFFALGSNMCLWLSCRCVFWSANRTSVVATVLASNRLIRENWNLKYSAFFLLCPIPSNSGLPRDYVPHAVSVSRCLRHVHLFHEY